MVNDSRGIELALSRDRFLYVSDPAAGRERALDSIRNSYTLSLPGGRRGLQQRARRAAPPNGRAAKRS
ncbi:unnamed protein product [Strongylus vulgaris]|uniref:Uncharacterized protein n=1 Tax=Strongylus vulgaris TaxID=40348 RepID=A0A3P7JIY1_STRVU|nr:unnamed protein product [Strongylus vulgaris]